MAVFESQSVVVERDTDGSLMLKIDLPGKSVNVLNTRTTFLINRYFALRGILQFDSSRHQLLTDLLASWELLPGTVAYAGYGSLVERQDWDGTQLVPGTGPYRTSQRGLFFKASYVHRF